MWWFGVQLCPHTSGERGHTYAPSIEEMERDRSDGPADHCSDRVADASAVCAGGNRDIIRRMSYVACDCWLVEVDAGRVVAGGSDLAPTFVVPIDVGQSPEEILRSVVESSVTLSELHSTSWRYVYGSLRLNFVAMASDLLEGPLTEVRPYEQVRGDGASSDHELVLSHAVRHVSFLLRTDPSFLAVANRDEWVRAAAIHEPDVFRDLT